MLDWNLIISFVLVLVVLIHKIKIANLRNDVDNLQEEIKKIKEKK